jgi:hypothetical protein
MSKALPTRPRWGRGAREAQHSNPLGPGHATSGSVDSIVGSRCPQAGHQRRYENSVSALNSSPMKRCCSLKEPAAMRAGIATENPRVPRSRAKRMFAASELPSAKTLGRDIPFHRVHRGRKPAECGHSWRIVRTTAPGPRGHFRPFPASLRPLSLTQPNHGRFGTDVGSSIIQ